MASLHMPALYMKANMHGKNDNSIPLTGQEKELIPVVSMHKLYDSRFKTVISLKLIL